MPRTIRTLTASEVETLVDWAAGEGWNPGVGDAAALRAADPAGFIGAFVGNEMVAGISAVAYGADFGFIGLYICRPDRRGEGHGKAVWDAGMTRLGNRIIGLDGVAEQRANYQRKGFVPAYETVRFSGRAAGLTGGGGARSVTAANAAEILAYDRQCFPARREAFLREWLQAPRIALMSTGSAGIAGYGVARRCREGFKVGPLFADEMNIALALMAELAGRTEGGELHVDVPATQAGFTAMLQAAGMVPGFTTTRMYKGGKPGNAPTKVFGITTLELG
ncbi:GNAT family N-acetyltransferase [Mesorhizobium sp. M1C.F.Ca.ET.193.01.1.1]|uniref:GNAT family N-acetyltransferase n=1 Tax=unclassified Mesorhizobium TaxID=325217 RepID=UPI000FD3108A|nr:MULTISPECIES: GNAT family N-acetyltransferase [unclassified Mesorhizobium]TGS98870.1 GNAT family N-acetyltransferase [bacterium M00.F.Ca.ET.177.01.1.1]TGQ52897.1 GNAT family N-acetyltransferase [Mesorhizobium sp. M1C.F.Ca.ET.210.01.1.1]TGQ70183.1 GNAT family N-acetyltransferase [Mesorhizobium sp. M1C.F.Ca.ET.212.01.1.1]TGR05981.1 GNAT family N-acetyltransferase [Mesorhizobium sp. M1C.F.Ca.ET.204.01.1.1]TGR26720.1 GNAT family N-acetyltransferase [Mesorhizobium sp. M1C.F.Ca.ET.196.01.1.1]